jgi:hypothetical protein
LRGHLNDEDFWPDRLYRRDPVKELITQGADLILNISASPWHAGKERTRLAMLQRVARDEKVPLVQVNLVGANDELIFDGHSVAVSRTGIARQGRAFRRGRLRWRWTSFASSFVLASPASTELTKSSGGGRERNAHGGLFAALSLGVRDYVRKCGFKSVVVGLSGGIDSAITAALAVDALGADKVMGISMPARYSSEGSLRDAAALAKNLGIRYEVLPIEGAFKAVEAQLAGVFAGTKPNEAEENIQSRLRGDYGALKQVHALVLTRATSRRWRWLPHTTAMCGALAVIGRSRPSTACCG